MKDNKISTRIKDFIIKTISVKIIIWFGVATGAFFIGILPWQGWLLVSGLCFASRTTEKVLLKYFSKGEGNE